MDLKSLKAREKSLLEWTARSLACIDLKVPPKDWLPVVDHLNSYLAELIRPSDKLPSMVGLDERKQILLHSLVRSNSARRQAACVGPRIQLTATPRLNILHAGAKLSSVTERKSSADDSDWKRIVQKAKDALLQDYNTDITQMTKTIYSGEEDKKKPTKKKKSQITEPLPGNGWNEHLLQQICCDQFELGDFVLFDMERFSSHGSRAEYTARKKQAEECLHVIRLFFAEPCGWWNESTRVFIARMSAFLLTKIIRAHVYNVESWTKWMFQCALHEPDTLFHWLRWWVHRDRGTAQVRRTFAPVQLKPDRIASISTAEQTMARDWIERVTSMYILPIWAGLSDPCMAALLTWLPVKIDPEYIVCVQTLGAPLDRLKRTIDLYLELYAFVGGDSKKCLTHIWTAHTLPIFMRLLRYALIKHSFM